MTSVIPARSRMRSAWISLGACSLLTAACASGPAPSDHFYRLQARPAPAPLAAPLLTGTLMVGHFRAESIATGRALLFRANEGAVEVQRRTYHLWVDPPPAALQEQVARYLREANAAQRVVTPELRVPSDYELFGRLLRLESLLGSGSPRVVVELELGLIRSGDRAVLLHDTYRQERELDPSAGVSSSAAAFNRALGELLARLLEDLAAL